MAPSFHNYFYPNLSPCLLLFLSPYPRSYSYRTIYLLFCTPRIGRSPPPSRRTIPFNKRSLHLLSKSALYRIWDNSHPPILSYFPRPFSTGNSSQPRTYQNNPPYISRRSQLSPDEAGSARPYFHTPGFPTPTGYTPSSHPRAHKPTSSSAKGRAGRRSPRPALAKLTSSIIPKPNTK